MPSHPDRVRSGRRILDPYARLAAGQAVITTRCYGCDTFFEARTPEAARSMLESHQAREGHLPVFALPMRDWFPDDHLGGTDA